MSNDLVKHPVLLSQMIQYTSLILVSYQYFICFSSREYPMESTNCGCGSTVVFMIFTIFYFFRAMVLVLYQCMNFCLNSKTSIMRSSWRNGYKYSGTYAKTHLHFSQICFEFCWEHFIFLLLAFKKWAWLSLWCLQHISREWVMVIQLFVNTSLIWLYSCCASSVCHKQEYRVLTATEITGLIPAVIL